jgi:hypothetical protein
MKSYFITFLFISLLIPCYANTIYVDTNTPDNNDGSSWDKAYKYLQDALAVISDNDEIRVADGIYRPDETSADPNGTGDRYAAFEINDLTGIALMGGYAGYGAVDPNARDVGLYETVLSGDCKRSLNFGSLK